VRDQRGKGNRGEMGTEGEEKRTRGIEGKGGQRVREQRGQGNSGMIGLNNKKTISSNCPFSLKEEQRKTKKSIVVR
jgi:hypothetical protein